MGILSAVCARKTIEREKNAEFSDYCSSKGSRGSRLGSTASSTSSAAAAVAAPFLSPTWESPPPHIPAGPPHSRGKVALVRSYRKDDWIVIDIKEVPLPVRSGGGSSRRRSSCISCSSIGSTG